MPPSLPSLNALRAFEAAARLESVSRAAAELHVTHGAVSRQIRLLEESIGQALFVRNGRGLALTASGIHLRDAAGHAFGQLQEAIADIRHGQNGNPLVLGCPGSVLARWMIPRLGQLAIDLPGLTLHVAAQEGEQKSPLATRDALLLVGEPPWPADWQIHPLAAEWIGPVVSPHYIGLPALGDSPASLLPESLLHTASRPQAWPIWAQAHGLDPAHLRMGTEFPHLYYLLEAAVAGLGVAIAPQPLVAADVGTGRLLAPWGFSKTGGHWILATRRGNPDPRIDKLAQWLAQQLDKS